MITLRQRPDVIQLEHPPLGAYFLKRDGRRLSGWYTDLAAARVEAGIREVHQRLRGGAGAYTVWRRTVDGEEPCP